MGKRHLSSDQSFWEQQRGLTGPLLGGRHPPAGVVKGHVTGRVAKAGAQVTVGCSSLGAPDGPTVRDLGDLGRKAAVCPPPAAAPPPTTD